MTPAAAHFVQVVARSHGVEPVLRIRVIGGGCAGLTWDWILGDPGIQPGDLRRITDGTTVVVDARSAAWVRGAVVDTGLPTTSGLRPTMDPAAGKTIVLRPLGAARNLCSCGDSFSA